MFEILALKISKNWFFSKFGNFLSQKSVKSFFAENHNFLAFEGSKNEKSSYFWQKMYLEADFRLGCSRKWVEKVQIVISLQIFYSFPILHFKVEKNKAESSRNVPFFGNFRLPCLTSRSKKWKPLRIGRKMTPTWKLER